MTPQSQGQYHTLRIDRQNGNVDLISNTMRLRHYIGTNGMSGLDSSRPNSPTIWDMQQPRPALVPLQPVRPKSGGDS